MLSKVARTFWKVILREVRKKCFEKLKFRALKLFFELLSCIWGLECVTPNLLDPLVAHSPFMMIKGAIEAVPF